MEAMLARELKSWQREFRSKNGREPTKRDMAEHPDIASTYATWTAMKDEGKSSSSSKTKAVKQKRTEDAAAPSTPAKRRAMPPPPQAASPSTTLRTPSKRTQPAATAGTPSAAASSSRNPFKTPVKASARAPQTPSTGRSIVDGAAVATPTTPASGRAAGSSSSTTFVDGTSPSKLRSLLQSTGAARTPNTRAAQRVAERTRTEEALKAAYTPRTKARKRLRGEEVPPTPARASKRVSRGKSGAAFGTAGSSAGGGGGGDDEAARGSGAGSAWARKAALESLQEEGDVEMDRVSPFKAAVTASKKSKAAAPPKFVPLLPGPSGGGDSEDSESSDEDDDEAMLRPGPSNSQGAEAELDDVDWAMDLDDDGDAAGAAAAASPPDSTSPTKRKPQWVIRTAVVSDDDEEEARPTVKGKGKASTVTTAAPRKSTTITVRPYQRYGSLRVVDSADGDAEDGSRANTAGALSSDDEGACRPSSSAKQLGGTSRTQAATLASPPLRQHSLAPHERNTSSPDTNEDATTYLSSLRIASPQTKGARAHARAVRATHIAHLLGGEAEELELDPPDAAEGAAGTGAQGGGSGLERAKNWGAAKGREAASMPQGKGKGKVTKKEALAKAAAEAEALRPPKPPPRTYDRAGRSGMASDEVPRARVPVKRAGGGELGLSDEDGEGGEEGAEPRETQSEDEDWHSEVSSAEYGLGDGVMDDMDVI